MKELLEIQSVLKAPKVKNNLFGGFKYRSCESILEALKPHLIEQKCTLTLTDKILLVGERYYIEATATLMNDCGEIVEITSYAREEEIKKGMDSSQITGSCSSYARKYALNGMFLIDDSNDSDSTNEGDVDKIYEDLVNCKDIDMLKTYYLSLTIDDQKKYGNTVNVLIKKFDKLKK